MCATEKKQSELPSLEKTATDWVYLLVMGEFDQAVKPFDKTMSSQITAAKLQDIWSAVIAQTGVFESTKGTKTAKADAYDIVFVTCKFSNTLIDIQLTFDADRKIAGLFFKPSGT
jgi:hypothetical protein